jgi:transcription elongation factor Elf1
MKPAHKEIDVYSAFTDKYYSKAPITAPTTAPTTTTETTETKPAKTQ